MSPLPGLEGQPHALAVLGSALAPAGSPSHAYLFCGPAASGKAGAARAFAGALLAEGAADPESATRRAHDGVHPDLTWVAPSSSAGILIGDVDEAVVSAAARTPFEARRRVFVIEGADELNDEAANRLLKTLEEPATTAHLILLTSRPGNVLPTIVSRCQQVRFAAPSAAVLAERLEREGVAPEAARACGRLALGDGRRARLLALGDGPALRAGAEAVARGALAGRLAERPWTALLALASERGDAAVAEVRERVAADLDLLPAKERKRVEREGEDQAKRAQRRARARAIDLGLSLVGLWLRDVACLAEGADEVVHHTDRLDALREDADGAAAHRVRAGIVVVDDTRASFALNPSDELALEALAYRLAALLS